VDLTCPVFGGTSKSVDAFWNSGEAPSRKQTASGVSYWGSHSDSGSLMTILRSRQRRAWRRKVVRALTDRFFKPSTPARVLPRRPPEKVAIIRPNHRLGNILLLTPLVQELERLWPTATVDIFGGGRMQAIFQGFPNVRNLITTPQPALKLLFDGKFRQQSKAQYDVVVNAEPQSQSARFIASRLDSGALIAPATLEDEAASRHLALGPVCAVREATSADLSAPFPRMSLRLSEPEVDQGEAALAGLFGRPRPSPIIGLYPFGDKQRDYPVEWWQTLIAAIRQKRPQAGLVEILPAHGEKRLKDADAWLDSHDLRELCAQLRVMDLVVATDSGMMHLAACSGAPTFGLFKVTEPAAYAPFGNNNRHWTWPDAAPDDVANAVSSSLA
jgi:ADP-heptose:LPS heptosyltransferase